MARRAKGKRRATRSRTSRTATGSRAQRWLLRWGWLLPVVALVVGGAILGLTYAFARIPLPRDIELPSSATVYDAKGRLIGTYSDEVRRFLIGTQELPEFIGQAVIAAEDRDFYEHSGVSMRGIVRAAWANLTGGEIQQGGSTITQQYVKNAVLEDPERTVTRKVKEAVLAIKLERRFSKEEILGFYLNTIYLGRGAYGIEAAATTYFGYEANDNRGVTAAEQLKLGEAAFLAGIIPAPESYQPDENPGGANQRRDRVLDLMEREGFITASEAADAKRDDIKIARNAVGSVVKRHKAAHFMEWLRRDYLYPEYKEELFTRGLKIYTTLDLDMQGAAEDAVEQTLTEPTDPPAALVSMTPKGEVRALIGGRDFTSVKKARGFDYATDFPGRQAGSAFKPFTLLTAIEDNISLQSTFSGGSPKIITDPVCADPDGTLWDVQNFGGSSFGTINLDQATVNSVNTVYAQLIAEIGPEKVADLLDEFEYDRPGTDAKRNLHSPSLEVCSLALGTLDVTPLEMAQSYATFAGRGALPEVMPIRFITNSDGDCIKAYRSDKAAEDCEEEEVAATKQIVDENSADVLNQTLTHVVTSGTGTAANDGLEERQVAGKTGTAQDHSNAWFAGYTPQLATVVWMGYPIQQTKADPEGFIPLMEYCLDPVRCRPVHGVEVTGGSFPAQIFAAFMSVATENMEIVAFPIPTDMPDEILNPQPTFRPGPAPTKSGKAEPDETEEPSPEPSEPEPEPTEDDSPGPLPTNSDGGDDDG